METATATLKAKLLAQQQIIKEQESLIKKLVQRIEQLERSLYGKSSERSVSSKEKTKPPSHNKQPGKYRKKNKFTSKQRSGFNDEVDAPLGTFPDYLPRKDIFEDNLPEGADLKDYEKVGTVTRESLSVIPSQKYVKVIHKTTYKLKSNGSFPEFIPQHPLGRCKVDSSFIVYTIIQKVLFHIPLYRLEKILELQGINCQRASMARWINKIASLLEPIVTAIRNDIKEAKVIHSDETPTLVRCDESNSYERTYFWNLVSPNMGIVFFWTRKRNNKEAQKILADIKGTLVSDALAIYDSATSKHEINWQICWIHIRRNFIKVTDNTKLAKYALNKINLVLAIDKAIRKRTKSKDKFDKRVKYRQRFLNPLVDRIKEWIKKQRHSPQVESDSQLVKALDYLDTRWELATTFISNPYVLPHNNISEQHFRYLKLGVKNWLFCSSEIGAKTLATLYSLVYSAKMLGINPYFYLNDLLQQIHLPGVKARDLVPEKWKANREKLVVPKLLQSKI